MTTKLQQFCIDILPVIQAGAKGARIGSRGRGTTQELAEISPVHQNHIAFKIDREYQVMRLMIEVNGFKVPTGERVQPKYLAEYRTPNPTIQCLVNRCAWIGDGDDLFRLSNGLIYLAQEDAIARAKAMLGIDPYAVADPDVPDFDDAGDVPE